MNVAVAEAETRLPDLMRRAAEGEDIVLTNDDGPAVRLVPVVSPRKPIDIDALRALTAKMPYQQESSADLVRRMRDEGY